MLYKADIPGLRMNLPARFANVQRLATQAGWAILLLSLAGLSGCDRASKEQTERKQIPSETNSAGGVERVALAGGWFEMGSNDADEPDQKLHRVWVSALVMDKYPVTLEEYERRMGKNPSLFKAPRNPVEQIRWPEAALYCNARSQAEGLQAAYDTNTWECRFEADGYRLPTEAEYEYALRAGTRTVFHCGSSPEDLKRYAWFKANSPRGPHPVGEKPGNAWGLCDLAGNVWEWCNDFYQEDYYQHSPERDPRGPAVGQNRVVRGGCWNSKPDHCRAAYRYYEMPVYTDTCFAKDLHGQIGFRCVKRSP